MVLMTCASCVSSEVDVPEDATRLEIVQLAQTAFDSGFKKKALKYYEVLLQRYGTDTATYIEGRYEIAHIYVKKRKYDLARPMLEEIVEIYASSQPGQLPGAYRKLAQKDLDKINASKHK